MRGWFVGGGGRGQVTGGAAVSLCGVEESAASQELQLRDAV